VSDGFRRDLLELKRQVEASARAAASRSRKRRTHSAVQRLSKGPPVAPVPAQKLGRCSGKALSPVSAETNAPEAYAADSRDVRENGTETSVPDYLRSLLPGRNRSHRRSSRRGCSDAVVPATTVQRHRIAPTPVVPSPHSAACRAREMPPNAPQLRSCPLRPRTDASACGSGGRTGAIMLPSAHPHRLRLHLILQLLHRHPGHRLEQRMKSVFALEEVLGRNWLNKIGIVLIVLGVAYFGIKELGELGPLGKSRALVCGVPCASRRRHFSREARALPLFSYPSIGGGWALLFFTTYALNHVTAMRVLNSLSTDLILMLIVALAMVLHTLRYRSQVVTGMAFLLGYWTVSLSNDDVYSLSAGVILAISLVIIVLKMGWYELEIFGILSSYANHIYWLYRLLGPERRQRDTRSRNTTPALPSSFSTGSPIASRTSFASRSPAGRTHLHRSRAAQHTAADGSHEVPVGAPGSGVHRTADHRRG
jgi:hypothetical protein